MAKKTNTNTKTAKKTNANAKPIHMQGSVVAVAATVSVLAYLRGWLPDTIAENDGFTCISDLRGLFTSTHPNRELPSHQQFRAAAERLVSDSVLQRVTVDGNVYYGLRTWKVAKTA